MKDELRSESQAEMRGADLPAIAVAAEAGKSGKPHFLPGLSFCHPSVGPRSVLRRLAAPTCPVKAVSAKAEAVAAKAGQSRSKWVKPVWLVKLARQIDANTLK